MSTATARRVATCQHRLDVPSGTSYACTLPAGHAGDDDWADTMGMCVEDDDCRATQRQAEATLANPAPMNWAAYRTARENAVQHNH